MRGGRGPRLRRDVTTTLHSGAFQASRGTAVNPMRVLLLSSCLFVGGLAHAANDLPGGGIDPQALSRHVRVLASDEFEGRAPGSVGETRTVEYLIGQFSALGLEPGNPDGTWIQQVPLVGITPVAGDVLSVSRDGDTRELQPGADYVAYTKRVVDEVELDAEFVFVGYGAVAPEYDWNDFKEVDVSGKILLFLVNDPPSEDLFGGLSCLVMCRSFNSPTGLLRQTQHDRPECILLRHVGDLRGALNIFNWIE